MFRMVAADVLSGGDHAAQCRKRQRPCRKVVAETHRVKDMGECGAITLDGRGKACAAQRQGMRVHGVVYHAATPRRAVRDETCSDVCEDVTVTSVFDYRKMFDAESGSGQGRSDQDRAVLALQWCREAVKAWTDVGRCVGDYATTLQDWSISLVQGTRVVSVECTLRHVRPCDVCVCACARGQAGWVVSPNATRYVCTPELHDRHALREMLHAGRSFVRGVRRPALLVVRGKTMLVPDIAAEVKLIAAAGGHSSILSAFVSLDNLEGHLHAIRSSSASVREFMRLNYAEIYAMDLAICGKLFGHTNIIYLFCKLRKYRLMSALNIVDAS